MNFNDWVAQEYSGVNANERPSHAYDLNYDRDRFKELESKIVGYDEGYVMTDTVYKDLTTEKFWKISESSNSWDEGGDEEVTVEEVKPVEKLVIVYETI